MTHADRARIAEMLPGKKSDLGRTAKDTATASPPVPGSRNTLLPSPASSRMPAWHCLLFRSLLSPRPGVRAKRCGAKKRREEHGSAGGHGHGDHLQDAGAQRPHLHAAQKAVLPDFPRA